MYNFVFEIVNWTVLLKIKILMYPLKNFFVMQLNQFISPAKIIL